MPVEPTDTSVTSPPTPASPGSVDVLGMYPKLREDHIRYLQKWGFITPPMRGGGTQFSFQDLGLLRQIHAELQQGVPFRRALRDLQASREGQLAFDFRLDVEPVRILALARKEPTLPAMKAATAADVTLDPNRRLTKAEQQFLEGSQLDDGTAERQQEAARAYRRALHDDPNLVPAIINLANIRYACDELPEAQALYERALRLDDTFFEAHFNLGNIHHDLGRHAEAVDYYRRALSLNGQYAEGHFYLAVTLEKLGRSAEARQHWRAYQFLAPDGEWVDLAKEFGDEPPSPPR
ncbi:MAG: tetratricopeptide repeat protein [Vicinamibacterales bacterium]